MKANKDDAATKRMRLVIMVPAIRPCSGSEKVRSIKTDAMVRVSIASGQGIKPTMTMLMMM